MNDVVSKSVKEINFNLQKSQINAKMALSPGDPNSYSRPDLALVRHTHMQLNINFNKNILEGNVTLDVTKEKETDSLILDVRGLLLLSIINVIDGSKLEYHISDEVEYGSKLTVKLPKDSENRKKYKIKITYETSPNSTALQWLKPEQTAGRKHPYLFSQCEAIHARAMLPCQDTPSAKATYSAEITVPSELTVIMSALRDGVVDTADKSKKVYKFHQPVVIPSYLIAIAAGALVSKKVGPISYVWSEQEFIDQSAHEFGETAKMLNVAEDICGPYVWGIYDLLILPPSFPFGGMENPCLTFVTPTLLAGDRSLTDVVAHEISHSWTGNLVTNANFEHFWLNEGFTTYLEGKIMGKIHGEPYRHFMFELGLIALKETVKTLGENNQLTNLIPNLNGIDPDDAFSSVPYEKGCTLLFYLEQLLGMEKFDHFFKSYLQRFQYESIVSTDWKAYLYEYFESDKKILDTIDWETWFYKPGMPPVIPAHNDSLMNECCELANRWISWNESELNPFNKTDIDKLLPMQKVFFLNKLFSADELLSITKLKILMETYGFASNKNAEIRFIWLRLCIKHHWEDKVDDALRFVTEVGRMKYVRPIYRDFYEWVQMRQKAIDNYERTKDKMMYVTAKMVAKDLHLEE